MPFDSKVLPPSEFRNIAIHLGTFDTIRDDVNELFQGLSAIKELVESECAHLERADKEDMIPYAKWRGYSAMSLHVDSVSQIDRRIGKAIESLLRECPSVRAEKDAYDGQFPTS
ncbi:hypothetical protein [Reyranella sp.]|uniref:hypothetical protein n=1 Tax=Reyranella sp. TaxID=1929291 RepID=UPI002730EE45|nr:hypothetical protein [Reyranella sp.]MDP2376091.1 hypothetical protein [Reyranella sp.]